MYLADNLGCTLEELGDRMSSEEYSIRRHFYFRSPIGTRQTNVLLADFLEMYYAIHKRADVAGRTAHQWLYPVTRATAVAPSTFADIGGFVSG